MKAQNYLLKSLDSLMDCVALVSTAKSELCNLPDETIKECRTNKVFMFADLGEAISKIKEAYGLIENILIQIDRPF